MQRTLTAPWTLCLALIVTGQLPGEEPTPRELIDRAVQAAGGEAKLSRLKGALWKARGTFYEAGTPIAFTGEWATQAPERSRTLIEGNVNGQKFKIVSVFDGSKGWIQVDNATEEMTADQVAEAREEAYAGNVTRLVTLKDKNLSLTLLGETKVGGRPALGVKVAHKEHRDSRLFFDKQTHRLVQSAVHVKDNKTGKEVDQETVYSDYKEIEGVQLPTKITIKRAGKLFVEAEATDYQLKEKLDDNLFTRP